MAGAGFKTFNTGDVLTASDVNTYLMQQTTMVFADASARSTALGANVAEGMISYLKDTNSVERYDGSSWGAIGAGDIEGVTAGTGLTGGGTSGTVTLNYDIANYGNATFVAGRNKIINGDLAINQRNFSSNTGGYGFDRFQLGSGDANATYSAQTFTAGTAPVSGYEARNYARIVTTNQSTSGQLVFFNQNIEDVRTFAGQTVTVSFWAQAGSGTPKIAVELSQQFGSGGSPSSDVFTYAGQVTLSTSWARYSVSVAIPSISGKTIGTTANTSSLALNLWVSAGSSFNSRTGSLGLQNNTFNIWGVQVETGSVASPFQTATGTIQGELAACQRYYFRTTPGAAGRSIGSGYAANTTIGYIGVNFPVAMRIVPTALEQSGTASDYSIGYTTTDTACSSVPAYFNGSDTYQMVTFTVASGLTAGHAIRGRANATGAYLAWSAEL